MFNNKTSISIYLLFFLISFDLNAVDEFDYNLLNEKLNRLEQEISDIQKSLYVPNDNISIKKDRKPVSSKYQIRINKIENDYAKMNGKFEEIFFRLDQLQGKLDKITSDVDFRLSTNNDTSSGGLPISKRDRSHEKDTYAYPKNTSDVNTSGGDTEILGTIKKKDNIDEPFEVARNFQTPDDLFNYGKESLRNLNYSEAEKYLQKAVEILPLDPIINDHYADTLWMLNKHIQARYFWKHVLSLDAVEQKLKDNVSKKLIFGIVKKL